MVPFASSVYQGRGYTGTISSDSGEDLKKSLKSGNAGDVLRAARRYTSEGKSAVLTNQTRSGRISVRNVKSQSSTPEQNLSSALESGSAGDVVRAARTYTSSGSSATLYLQQKSNNSSNLQDQQKQYFTSSLTPQQEKINVDIDSMNARQETFFNSPGFRRVDATASFLTGGGGKPVSERSFIGRTAQEVITAPLLIGTPAFGGFLASTADKFNIFREKLSIGDYEGVKSDFSSAIKPAIAETFKPSNIILAATFGIAGGYAKQKANLNKAVFEDFKDVKQTSQDVVFARDVSRESKFRYIETNTIPGADFVVSDLVKSKQSTISQTPKETTLKFDLYDKGRSGTRTIVQNIDTGKFSMIERIQKEGTFFKNDLDVMKFTESVGDNKYRVSVFKTSDYMGDVTKPPKFFYDTLNSIPQQTRLIGFDPTAEFAKTLYSPTPLFDKTFINTDKPISLGTSREYIINPLREDKPKFAREAGTEIFTRETLVGDYLQTTRVKTSTAQQLKLEKSYIVDSSKEYGFSLTSKGQKLGIIEKYKSSKARPDFGLEELNPNTIFREGFKVIENKNPQIISEVRLNKDVDINIRKLSATEKKGYTSSFQGDIFLSKSSLSQLSTPELMTFAKVNKINVFQPRSLGLSTILLDPTSIKTSKTITFPSQLSRSYENLGSLNVNIPSLKTPRTTSFPLNALYNFKDVRQNTNVGIINKDKSSSSPFISIKYDSIISPKTSNLSIFKLDQRSSQSLKQAQVLKLSTILESKQSYKNIDRSRGINFSIPKIKTLTMPFIPFFSDISKKKKTLIKKRKLKLTRGGLSLKDSNVYILPDLRSVSVTEQYKFSKGLRDFEARTPRATSRVKGLALQAFKGGSAGFIPTEEIRVKKGFWRI